MFQKSTLENGMRVVTSEMLHTQVGEYVHVRGSWLAV